MVDPKNLSWKVFVRYVATLSIIFTKIFWVVMEEQGGHQSTQLQRAGVELCEKFQQ